MSEEEDNVIKTQPTSPFESEPVDKAVYERMLHTFQSMGLNPKGNNPAELGQWMKDYIAQTKDIPPGASKVEQTGVRQDVKPKIPPLSLPSEGSSISRTRSVTTLSPYPPKIRTFSVGDNKGDTTSDIWRYEDGVKRLRLHKRTKRFRHQKVAYRISSQSSHVPRPG